MGDERRIEDQKAILKIKELAEKRFIELFISANVNIELNKCHSGKRKQIDEFWKSAKPQLISQEIGFDGNLIRIGNDRKYQDFIDKQESLLSSLNDKSLDSSIILNSKLFGMIFVTADYKCIKRLKRKLGSDYKEYKVMTPAGFINHTGFL